MRTLASPPSRLPFGDLVKKAGEQAISIFSNSRGWVTWLFDLYQYVKIEPWHEIGGTDEPAFQNSWANVGGANDETAAYRLEGSKKLHLKGYIDSGTSTDGTVIFTLPTDYRPVKDIRISGAYVQGSSENSYHIVIQTDGDVTIEGVSGVSPSLSLHLIVDIDNG